MSNFIKPKFEDLNAQSVNMYLKNFHGSCAKC